MVDMSYEDYCEICGDPLDLYSIRNKKTLCDTCGNKRRKSRKTRREKQLED